MAITIHCNSMLNLKYIASYFCNGPGKSEQAYHIVLIFLVFWYVNEHSRVQNRGAKAQLFSIYQSFLDSNLKIIGLQAFVNWLFKTHLYIDLVGHLYIVSFGHIKYINWTPLRNSRPDNLYRHVLTTKRLGPNHNILVSRVKVWIPKGLP